MIPQQRAHSLHDQASTAVSAEVQKLFEGYYQRAARQFNIHVANPAHQCACCGTAWPCQAALAAAMLSAL